MIQIPNEPAPGAPLSANWAKQVVRCLRALTPRESATVRPNTNTGGTIYDVKRVAARGFTHPWMATVSGDDKVNIGPGSVLSYDDVAGYATLREFAFFEGGEVTVTDDGSIYGAIPWAASYTPLVNITIVDPTDGDQPVTILRVFPNAAETPTVQFLTTPPTTPGFFYWEIAKVTLDDDDNVSVRQILTHNPELWSIIEPP